MQSSTLYNQSKTIDEKATLSQSAQMLAFMGSQGKRGTEFDIPVNLLGTGGQYPMLSA